MPTCPAYGVYIRNSNPPWFMVMDAVLPTAWTHVGFYQNPLMTIYMTHDAFVVANHLIYSMKVHLHKKK